MVIPPPCLWVTGAALARSARAPPRSLEIPRLSNHKIAWIFSFSYIFFHWASFLLLFLLLLPYRGVFWFSRHNHRGSDIFLSIFWFLFFWFLNFLFFSFFFFLFLIFFSLIFPFDLFGFFPWGHLLLPWFPLVSVLFPFPAFPCVDYAMLPGLSNSPFH